MSFGCLIRVKRNVTKSDIYALCQDLALRFGTGHTFLPLERVEGWISWEMWPGKENGQCKSLRFHMNGKNKLMWPHVDGDCSWQNNEDVAIECDTETIHGHQFRSHHIRIESYDHNAVWTSKEWNIFKQCLKKYTC